jgi:predicted metal-dependent phosphoesterase TrpH
MLVDLHVHTRLYADSNVEVETYLAAAARDPARVGAICLTEHRLFSIDPVLDERYAQLAESYQVRIFKGIEADTDLGHLLIFGVTAGLRKRFDLTSRMLRAERLIEYVHDDGGIAIPAHPFRDSGYGARLDALLAKLGPALSVVEAINGQNSPQQNTDALMACEKLGLTAVAGSDAHFATPKWFLTCATEFACDLASVAELCAELRSGRAKARQLGGAADADFVSSEKT